MKFLLILIINFFLLFPTFGQKRVLVEKFTSAFCGSCPNAALMIQDLQVQYPGTIWINHHKPTWWTDYELENEQSSQLWAALNVPGTPRAMIDRTALGNQLVLSSSAWANLVESQASEPHYANISVIDVGYDLNSRNLTFNLEVEFESSPPAGEFRLSAMIVEDSVTGREQHNYYNDVEGHPLEGLGDIIWDYTHRNVTRAILDSTWGTAGVIPDNPETGLTYTHGYNYHIPAEYDADQIKIVGVLGYHNENDINQMSFLNATEVRLDEFDLVLTSVEAPQDEQTILIYPNPVSDDLNVGLSYFPDKVQVFNSYGSLLKVYPAQQKDMTLLVSDLPEGLYFLKIEAEGRSMIQIFMLVR